MLIINTTSRSDNQGMLKN